MLRWYPPQWRSRYGDEMAVLLEDTYGSAGRVPLRVHVALARAGVAQRVREAGFAGSAGGVRGRLRAGALLVLYGWALFLVAGGIFAKLSDNWLGSTPTSDRWVASTSYDVVALAGALGCGLVLLAALVTLPAFVRLVRGGGWHRVRRPICRALVATTAAAVLFGTLLIWSWHLTPFERNGGLPAYGAFFVLFGLAVVVATACVTAAAAAVARWIEPTDRSLRSVGFMAVGVATSMMLICTATLSWWVWEAVHARDVLTNSIGNGIPFSSDSVPPALLGSALLMLLGLILGVWGTMRITGPLREAFASDRSWHTPCPPPA